MFHQLLFPILNVGCTLHAHPTQSINYNISLTWMVVDIHVIVFQQLQLPSLTWIQLRLCDHVLETFVVYEHIHMQSIEVFPHII